MVARRAAIGLAFVILFVAGVWVGRASADSPTAVRTAVHRVVLAPAPSTTTTTLAPYDESHWIAIGRCEQPGTGYQGIDWSAAGWNGTQYFEGGLGIRADLYQSIAGKSALVSTPLEQMMTADIVLARYGPGAWGCKAD